MQSKKYTFLSDIQAISDKVQIVDDYTYKILDREFPVTYQHPYTSWNQPITLFGQNTGEEQQNRINLQNQLAGAIYSFFYCPGRTDMEQYQEDNHLNNMPSKAARNEYIKLLSAANKTEEGVNPYWTVYSIDTYGNGFVTKNGEIRYLTPNEWEFMNKSETQMKVGSIVNLKIKKEDTTIQEVFYHVKAAELLSQQASFVRIYFNTNFEGAKLLVEEITSRFNFYKIPFGFKCLNHPDLFRRTDSAVLYLDKAFFRISSKILSMFIDDMQPFLKPDVPLFSLPLMPGMSFAEDPGAGQSFGMSRANIIAKGLISAFQKERNEPTRKLEEVLSTIEKNGLQIEKMHLKSNSHFPYDFSLLKRS